MLDGENINVIGLLTSDVSQLYFEEGGILISDSSGITLEVFSWMNAHALHTCCSYTSHSLAHRRQTVQVTMLFKEG